MSQATNQTFEIASIKDFLKIPEDRLDQFFSDFKDMLVKAKAMEALYKTAASLFPGEEMEKAAAEGMEFQKFTWIDDGSSESQIFNLGDIETGKPVVEIKFSQDHSANTDSEQHDQ